MIDRQPVPFKSERPVAAPPSNEDAERAVLGSVLLDREVIARLVPILNPSDFYNAKHATIYRAMRDLHDRGEYVDFLTLTSETERAGFHDAVYIASLLGVVPTPIHADRYAKLVADAAVMRRLISAGSRIAALGFDPSISAETAVEKADALLLDVASTRPTQQARPVVDVLREYLERLDRTNADAASGAIPTGFVALDRLLAGGLKRSDLIVLAARPSLGKTALATGIAAHASIALGAGVTLFSLEMSAEQMVERLICSSAGIESSRLREGPLTSGEEERLGRAIGPIAEAPLVIDDTGSLTPGELRARVRRIAADTPLDLVIVDHLQLVAGADGQNPVQRMTEISRQLKLLAKEQGVAVLALSQLSRAVEQRNPKIPMLSDLRESGSIEQDADVVMFIYRDDVYNRDSERQGIADIHVAKHRNGSTGQVSLLFNRQTTRFLDLVEDRSW